MDLESGASRASHKHGWRWLNHKATPFGKDHTEGLLVFMLGEVAQEDTGSKDQWQDDLNMSCSTSLFAKRRAELAALLAEQSLGVFLLQEPEAFLGAPHGWKAHL